MWIRRLSAITALMIGMSACAHAPTTESERQNAEARAMATVQQMEARDPGLKYLLDQAYAYAVFPDIGKGGFIVGGAHGRGVLFERGRPNGFIELNQASIGAQIGGQTFAEMIVFRDQYAVGRLKQGPFELAGNASAVALNAGAAATANFINGVAVFTMPHGGLMAELSVSGQKLNYQPRG